MGPGGGIKNNPSFNSATWDLVGNCNVRSVWTIVTELFSEVHYVIFFQALVERCIKAGCPKDGLVLDPFAGSGTVLRVAERLNRRGIGLDMGYHELQAKRLKNLQKELSF